MYKNTTIKKLIHLQKVGNYMQPHSILHSLIQTYHEYLLDGNFSALEIPRVRRLVDSNQPSSSPSFELYFEILNDNDPLSKQRNHSATAGNTLRNICVDFLKYFKASSSLPSLYNATARLFNADA